MKKINKIMSFILTATLCVPLNITTFAEETSDETVSETYEVTISPENYATVLLNTDATYHNSKDNISTATQYAYINSSTISKTMRAYTFITEFNIPLKSAVTALHYNGSLYREGNKTSNLTIKYIDSEIKTDLAEDMPTLVSGTYQATYDRTIETGETDENGNAITTTETVVSETDTEYKKWYNYANQFWASSTATAGSVNQSNEFSLDFSETVLDEFKNGDSDYLTFGTARITNNYSRYYYQSVPTLTLAYSQAGLMEYVKTATSENISEIITVLGETGLLQNSTNGYQKYLNIDDERKTFLEEQLVAAISKDEYATYSEFLSGYDKILESPLQTTLYEIEFIDAKDGTKYSDLTDATGKEVTVSVPAAFVHGESDEITAVLAMYDDTSKLLDIETKTIASTDTCIEFKTTVPANTFSIKVMCWDTLKGMIPLCEKTVLAENMSTVNLMTFNIRTIAGSDSGVKAWDNRKEALVEYLNNSNAAVICMQEVRVEQHEYINENISEMYELVYYTRETSDTAEGLIVAYNKEIFDKVNENVFWLSETPDVESIGWDAAYKRICVNVLLKHKEKGGMLNVFNVHLDHKGETAQVKGLELVLDKVSEYDYPAFVAGDFNVNDTSECYQVISDYMQDCQKTAVQSDEGTTHNAWGAKDDFSSLPIDFCFVSKEDMKPLTFKICRDKWNETNYYSDHYALQTAVKITFNN